MQDGVLVLDRDGRVAQHNPQAQRLLGSAALRGAELARLLPGFAERWRAWREGDARAAAAPNSTCSGRGLRLRLMETGAAEQLTVLFVEDTTRSRERGAAAQARGARPADREYRARDPQSAVGDQPCRRAAATRSSAARERGRLTRIIHDNTQRLERLVTDVLQLNRRDRARRGPPAAGAPGCPPSSRSSAPTSRCPRTASRVETAQPVTVDLRPRAPAPGAVEPAAQRACAIARAEPGSVRLVGRARMRDQVELNVIDDGPGVARREPGSAVRALLHHRQQGHRPRPVPRARTVRREWRGAGVRRRHAGGAFPHHQPQGAAAVSRA